MEQMNHAGKKRDRMTKFHMGKIGKKLFLTYMAIGIIPLALLIIYSFGQTLKRLEDKNIESVTISAFDKKREIENYFDSYRYSMSRILYNININKIFMADDKIVQNDLISKYLVSQINLEKSLDNTIDSIVIYAQDDYSSWNIQNINRVLNTDFYHKAINNGSSISVTDTQIIISRHFSSLYKYTADCVLTFYINRNLFFYKLAEMPQNRGLIILDKNLNTMYYSGVNSDEKARLSNFPNIVRKGKNQLIVDDTKLVSAGVTVSSVDWTVVCFDKSMRLFLPQNVVYISLQFIGVTILTVILSILFSRMIHLPILQLNDKMKRVGNGNYEIVTTDLRDDEFGEMQLHFNAMINRIRDLVEVDLKQKIKLRDSQLQVLHAQISPHFLYNTLSTINMRAILLGSDEIGILVKSLATFYQTSLNHGDLIISISDELKNLRAYINIQEIMHDNSFDVFYDIDDELTGYDVVNFILQPLAENAIEHGIEMIEERGIIAISGKTCNDGFILSVDDNGPGFVEGIPSLKKKGRGYGIYNVDARIKLLFGEKYGLSFSSSILGGARFEIHIPRYKRDDG